MVTLGYNMGYLSLEDVMATLGGMGGAKPSSSGQQPKSPPLGGHPSQGGKDGRKMGGAGKMPHPSHTLGGPGGKPMMPPGGSQRRPSGMELMMYKLHQGLAYVFTRSSRVMELVKVLPTVAGVPLNMTVQVTSVLTAGLQAKASVAPYLAKRGPLEWAAKFTARYLFINTCFLKYTIHVLNTQY
jgi:hypothetical protein